MEVDVGPGNSSCIRLVTTKSEFVREEGTCIDTDQNAALDRGRRSDP